MTPYTYLRKKNKSNSEIVSQILYGEKFKIIKKIGNWLKIKNSYDGYMGYIKKEKIIYNFNPTHKIIALKSSLFKKGNNSKFIKTKKLLPFASKVKVLDIEKKFSKIGKNQWVKSKDIVKKKLP